MRGTRKTGSAPALTPASGARRDRSCTSAAWRTNSLCERYLAEALSTLATVVNHKLPLAHGRLDVDENTEKLCDRHDAIVTAAQFGKPKPVRGKGIGRDGRQTSFDYLECELDRLKLFQFRSEHLKMVVAL